MGTVRSTTSHDEPQHALSLDVKTHHSQNNAKTTIKIMFQKLIVRSKKYIIFQSCKITSKKVQYTLKNKRYQARINRQLDKITFKKIINLKNNEIS